MSHTIVLQLTDEDFAPIEREAAATGRTPAELIVERLRAPATRRNGSPVSPPAETPAPTSDIITYEMVQTIFAETARTIAAETGRPAEEVLAEMKASMRPKPRPPLSESEKQAAWERLRRHRGTLGSNPRGSDNDLIDEDLAREYAATHDEEP
jgi:hypothetical protein